MTFFCSETTRLNILRNNPNNHAVSISFQPKIHSPALFVPFLFRKKSLEKMGSKLVNYFKSLCFICKRIEIGVFFWELNELLQFNVVKTVFLQNTSWAYTMKNYFQHKTSCFVFFFFLPRKIVLKMASTFVCFFIQIIWTIFFLLVRSMQLLLFQFMNNEYVA